MLRGLYGTVPDIRRLHRVAVVLVKRDDLVPRDIREDVPPALLHVRARVRETRPTMPGAAAVVVVPRGEQCEGRARHGLVLDVPPKVNNYESIPPVIDCIRGVFDGVMTNIIGRIRGRRRVYYLVLVDDVEEIDDVRVSTDVGTDVNQRRDIGGGNYCDIIAAATTSLAG